MSYVSIICLKIDNNTTTYNKVVSFGNQSKIKLAYKKRFTVNFKNNLLTSNLQDGSNDWQFQNYSTRNSIYSLILYSHSLSWTHLPPSFVRFELSVDEILKCYYSNESRTAVLSCGAVYYAV